MTGIFCVLVLLMTLSIFRIYYINASDYLAAAAAGQSSLRLDIASARGTIYDRELRALVNGEHRYVAAVMPTPQAAAALLKTEPEERREAFMERLSGGMPFATEVSTQDIYAAGVDIFRVPRRYGTEQLAPHLIGYLGNGGLSGAAGIERAYDEFLDRMGGKFYARYHVDAAGRLMQGGGTEIFRENETSAGGVALTLDRDIQRAVQRALSQGCEKGAAVVLDAATGDILAMASVPAFDQNNIQASLESADAPFVNRAVSGFNIGSVFKLVVSAAALESGFSVSRAYECEGYIDVAGQIFRCNNHSVHGVIDMQKALQVSCNTYFISLAQQLETRYLLSLCRHLGLGVQAELAPGLFTQSGNLPELQELQNPAALANFSFGQGSSLATPLQMAQVVAALANGGTAVSARLVRGLTYDGESIAEPTPIYAGGEIFSARTAELLRGLMIGVIEDGSGRTARPDSGGAGGKTSSAQTGVMDETGEKEIVHAWFAGFYPAQKPEYSIVVFVEGGESGEQAAAPIFKQIADGLADK